MPCINTILEDLVLITDPINKTVSNIPIIYLSAHHIKQNRIIFIIIIIKYFLRSIYFFLIIY
jgi:hypothetical protein